MPGWSRDQPGVPEERIYAGGASEETPQEDTDMPSLPQSATFPDIPMQYHGYSGCPDNWLDELREKSIFMAVTDGDDKELPADDSVTADGEGIGV